MRTAHIITRLIIGGAQENTLFNVDDQHHIHNDEVCLITGPGLGPEGTLEQRAIDRGLDLRVLPQLRRSLHPVRDARCYFALKRMLKDYQPDIVHTHSSKAGILGRRAAWDLGIPCVHSIHGAAFHFGQPAVLQKAYRLAEKTADRWCQHFITVCDAMSQQYLAAGIGTADKYTTIFSGMDVDAFLQPSRSPAELRQELGINDSHVVVGKIARLFNLKGHEFLIEAAPAIVDQVPNVRFLFVGDGILRSQFENRIAELGLSEHFIFAGLVPPDQVTNYIHVMDVVAHTSVWEGLARVLPQALICGKPVVSYDIDGAPEVCIDDETGYLVPARSIEPLAAAIVKLASDAALRERLGTAGRERFASQFRHEFMTERVREVYQRVLTRR
ncbi:MAG TPA: glycosyltransferase family 1 protein [Planctomycetes bacterium]|nr:glycosyltransferase family 1 protein [Fuerstiella sp.]HIK95395.1 glycosyltransferase family 1 protein [Planctomycetota bacterium]